MMLTQTKANDLSEKATLELSELHAEVSKLNDRVEAIKHDIDYIKSFFMKKEAKKQKRREKIELERLAQAKKEKELSDRKAYERIVWQMLHRPWDFMPAPRSRLSPKEGELIGLLARGKADKEIAEAMSIKADSVCPRVCAANKKLKLRSRQDLIDFYLGHQRKYREHRRRRSVVLLSWLLNPPPGFNYTRNLNIKWRRKLGRSRSFHYAGPFISTSKFKSLRPFEHEALKLKLRGLENSLIAEKLKIKPATLKSYFAEIRGGICRSSGVSAISDEKLLALYKKYLKENRATEPKR